VKTSKPRAYLVHNERPGLSEPVSCSNGPAIPAAAPRLTSDLHDRGRSPGTLITPPLDSRSTAADAQPDRGEHAQHSVALDLASTPSSVRHWREARFLAYSRLAPNYGYIAGLTATIRTSGRATVYGLDRASGTRVRRFDPTSAYGMHASAN
jgi:hypothetical protein